MDAVSLDHRRLVHLQSSCDAAGICLFLRAEQCILVL